ncbi:MAG: succinate dehydrogenase cytochrome b subunit [Bacteroidetes bacterium]|nr:succinate dehydrogenase cytochrome b subunit [Bacteroidales bacterium]MBU1010571.1 succinate dehydrogenase cytochrome b subunit [Bacteroidota bacterium]
MGKTIHYASITKKIVMSLAGLFLTSFLVVHLTINLFVLFDPSREMFNQAAHFMATNPFIQTFQWVLFIGFILHMIFGVVLQIQNWMARPVRYEKKGSSELSYFSKFMIHTGVVVFIFLIIHFANFFVKAKLGEVESITYASGTYEDLGNLIILLFKDGAYVAFYVVAILLLGFHLDHGFQSAFQSLGLNHSRYTPFIKLIGTLFSVLITLGFVAIPLVIYFS